MSGKYVTRPESYTETLDFVPGERVRVHVKAGDVRLATVGEVTESRGYFLVYDEGIAGSGWYDGHLTLALQPESAAYKAWLASDPGIEGWRFGGEEAGGW